MALTETLTPRPQQCPQGVDGSTTTPDHGAEVILGYPNLEAHETVVDGFVDDDRIRLRHQTLEHPSEIFADGHEIRR